MGALTLLPLPASDVKNSSQDCHGRNPPQLVHLRLYRPFWMRPLPPQSSHCR